MFDDAEFLCCQRVGGSTRGEGSILLCGKKRSFFPLHCLVGPDWPIVVMVYTLIIVITIGVLVLVSPLGWPVGLIGGLGCLSLLCFYSATACSDPGIIYKYAEDEPKEAKVAELTCANIFGGRVADGGEVDSSRLSRSSGGNAEGANDISVTSDSGSYLMPIERKATPPLELNIFGTPKPDHIPCGHCNIQRPRGAGHCHYCGTCVNMLDHHCPWSGKCIGKKNLNVFYLFLGTLCWQIYFLLGAFVYFCIIYYGNGIYGPNLRGPTYPNNQADTGQA